MSDWILYLLTAVALAFAVSSWWGVRKLKALHVRSTVGGDAHQPGLGQQCLLFLTLGLRHLLAEDILLGPEVFIADQCGPAGGVRGYDRVHH